MTVVSAFLVPGSPLPYQRPDNPPWSRLAAAYRAVGRALVSSRPDTIVLYSTQWGAVLDALWQTRARLTGTHVDANWYEYGDLEYDIRIDQMLAEACVDGSRDINISTKPVDYDQFPIDTGTIVANALMNPRGSIPLVIRQQPVPQLGGNLSTRRSGRPGSGQIGPPGGRPGRGQPFRYHLS